MEKLHNQNRSKSSLIWKRIGRLVKNSKPVNVGTLEANGTKLTNDCKNANAIADRKEVKACFNFSTKLSYFQAIAYENE